MNEEKLRRIQEVRARVELDLLELFMIYRYLPGEPVDGAMRLVEEVAKAAYLRAKEA